MKKKRQKPFCHVFNSETFAFFVWQAILSGRNSWKDKQRTLIVSSFLVILNDQM
jgi:hypothetical protein